MPTVTLTPQLSFPLSDEATPATRPPKPFTLNYTEKEDGDVNFTGAVTDQSLMGLIQDAKAAYVECIAGAGGTLKVNGSSVEEPPLKAGSGFWIWANADGGLIGLTVTTPGAARFRRYLFA